jgi:hypothetical protein
MQLKLLLFLDFYHCTGEIFPSSLIESLHLLAETSLFRWLDQFATFFIYVNAKVVGCILDMLK